MAKVTNRKNVLIRHSLGASTSWEDPINLIFTPDEVIVKSVSYLAGEEEAATATYITSDLINDASLCEFVGTVHAGNPHTIFQVGKVVQGNFRFSALLSTGAATTATGIIMIALEFVSYGKQ